MSFRRLPFFLREGESGVRGWLSKLGLPRDAPREDVMLAAGYSSQQLNQLMLQAGVGPLNLRSQYADTMDSHRLAWYAAGQSPEQGEAIWRALSRRYFDGKDTLIQPVRLDNHVMLMECAEEAGLDLDEASRVLEDPELYRKEILDAVRRMQRAGINSIPVLVFDVAGLAPMTSWVQDQRNGEGRHIHHGSGNKGEFRAVFERLHKSCVSADEEKRATASVS